MSRIAVAPEVAQALTDGRPAVALETTVVTHGLPHPQGLEVAAALEDEVRRHGAVPATVGVLDGVVRVGLDAAELRRLATTPGVAKLNLGNLAAHASAGGSGSTTVAATMFAAHHAGIAVLATGGIGGVHRGASESGDVSADLGALARFPVAVVCAGAKAVLDLPRTVEALETLGVPILGFRTGAFPAFYRRDSGLPVDCRFDDMEALAAAVRLHFAFGLAGVVVANPVPAEQEMPRELYESALAGALADAEAAGVHGRAVTPLLLERMRERTGGTSLAVNRALLLHNAAVAADFAVALAGAQGR